MLPIMQYFHWFLDSFLFRFRFKSCIRLHRLLLPISQFDCNNTHANTIHCRNWFSYQYISYITRYDGYQQSQQHLTTALVNSCILYNFLHDFSIYSFYLDELKAGEKITLISVPFYVFSFYNETKNAIKKKQTTFSW